MNRKSDHYILNAGESEKKLTEFANIIHELLEMDESVESSENLF